MGFALHAAGGLVPDVILDRDTLTAGEVALIQALQSHVAVFRDVLAAYALELRRGSSIGSEGFEGTRPSGGKSGCDWRNGVLH